MRKFLTAIVFIAIFVLIMSVFNLTGRVQARVLFQQPTVAMPTVTSTPGGPMVTVKSDQEQYINVRSGPGVFYDKIGVLLAGQQAPAKGRSVGGDWILIEYPGVPGGVAWVYTPYVNVTAGELSIIEPPPTPTPLVTATIDPTLAAQFVVVIEPTRLPTFTPPSPLVIPSYETDTGLGLINNIPLGMIIISIAALGILFGFFALSQGR